MPITDFTVRSAPSGAMIWDDQLKGFGIRVGKTAKTFIVLIGKGRRHKLGRYPLVSLQEARSEAKRILAEKELGRVKPTHTAFQDALGDFLAEKEQSTRPSTRRYYETRIKRHFKYDRKSVADITTRDVTKRLNELNSQPAEKRHAFVAIRTFLNWCLEQHIIDRSPMAHMSGPPLIKARERVLTPEELKTVWTHATPHPFGTIVRVLLLTGIRKGETQHITAIGGTGTIAGEHTKNRRPHVFPLSPLAQELLAHDLTFNGWSKAKKALDQKAPIAPWTLHDLRRTFATVHAQLGTPPHLIERLLNHVTGTMSPISRIYNQHTYLEECRPYVLAYENHLLSIVS